MKTEITIDAEIFTSLINKLENTKPAFDDFGRTASQFLIPEKFNRSEDAYGNKWQPLAP